MDISDDQDPLEGLEERLESHSKAFESLLALTPARDYYGSHVVDGKDPSEQWNRKKQTKEEKRAAKRAKLDPANQKSALDVLREREAKALQGKRKREEDGNEDEDVGATTDGTAVSAKRQKNEQNADAAETARKEKADRRKEKRVRGKEKKEAKKAKVEAKRAAKSERTQANATPQEGEAENSQEAGEVGDEKAERQESPTEMITVDVAGLADSEAMPAVEHEGKDNDEEAEASSAPTSPHVDSPAFDLGTNHSASSSSSSIIPPSMTDEPTNTQSTRPQPRIDTATPNAPPTKSAEPPSGTSSPKIVLPNIDHAALQERVRKRIEELRAARKADGSDGKPARSRQDLLEQRRKKDEQRKAAKKAQRQKAKEEEQRRRDEQLRGSGSPLSMDLFSPRSPKAQENNFSFSRLAFEDGSAADASLTTLQDPKRRKGPQDPRTALQAAQAKHSRLSGLDAEKRADIEDKDMWLNAKKRAHGERVRDDTSLLKKALKRKEKQKDKSEREWKQRERDIVKGREMKQKKREANLAKRREEKGGKGKKGGKPNGKGKKKGRPGFEGRFKA